MKVGFIIYSLGGGGAERVVVNLANCMVVQGDSVTIYTFDTQKIAYNVHPEVQIILCSTQDGNRLSKLCNRINGLKREIEKDIPDVIFAFTISMIPYALLGKKYGCKVIGSERTNPCFYKGKNKFFKNRLAPFCDGFVFQTEGAKRNYPYSVQKNSRVILNPVYKINSERDKIPGINICTAGRMAPGKDFEIVIRAFSDLNKTYPNSTLTFFGDFSADQNLKKVIETLKLKDKVLFKGFTNNLPGELTAYSMFIFSNQRAGMPNVLLEAMAAGLPCVATDCDFGPRELINNYENGILVPVGDQDSILNAMLWLLSHEKESNLIGDRAKKVRDRCALEKITQDYRKYAEWIGNKSIRKDKTDEQ